MLSLNTWSKDIISLSPGITDILVKLKLSSKIAATEQNYKLDNLPTVGNAFNIDIEKIVKLKPRVIYFEKIQNSRELEKLKKTNLSVSVLDLTSLSAILSSLDKIAELEGKSPAQLKTQFKNVNKVKENYSTLVLFGLEKKLNSITGAYALQRKSLLGDLLSNSGLNLPNLRSSYLTLEDFKSQTAKNIIIISNNPDDVKKLKKQIPSYNYLFISKQKKDLFNGPSSINLANKIIKALEQKGI